MSSPYIRGNNTYNSMNRNSRDQQAREGNISLMELENNAKWDQLGDQVSLLKSLSMDINAEVKSQNSMLDKMGQTFGSTTDMFKSTLGKLGNMIASGGSNHMYYLIVFIVLVFLLIYFMMGRK